MSTLARTVSSLVRRRNVSKVYLTAKHVVSRTMSSKVPTAPTWEPVDLSSLPEVPGIDLALIEQLERVSLVEMDHEEALRLLKNTAKAALHLQRLDTAGVEPLATVLEDRELWMREDEVTEGGCVQEILQNAAVVEEQYFVAPPGNIPLKKKSKEHLKKLLTTTEDCTDSDS